MSIFLGNNGIKQFKLVSTFLGYLIQHLLSWHGRVVVMLYRLFHLYVHLIRLPFICELTCLKSRGLFKYFRLVFG